MAAGVGTETPNELMIVFSDTVTAGFDAISGAVNGVFALVITLVVALTGIQWALSANREVLASGFGKILLIGSFAYLINDWQALSETIYDGFLELGLLAGGSSIGRDEFLNPGAIVEQGWLIVKAIGEAPAPASNPLDVVGNLMDALILAVAMLGIMLAFAILALQIIVSLLEFKIVTLGGFVLLPFGVWSKSAFLAERPLGYVVAAGLKVLAMAIVVSGARTVFDQLIPSTNPDIYEALTILIAAVLLAMLAMFIPNLAAALVTGGPALGAGAGITGGLAVGGAAAMAGAGLMKAGSAVLGSGRNSDRASRISSSSRAAAGAGSGRPPSSPPSTPRPSNDNPPPAPAPAGSAPTEAATSAPSRPGSAAPAPSPASTAKPIVEDGRNVKTASGAAAQDAPGSAPLVEELGRRRARQARAAARATGPDGLPLFSAASAGDAGAVGTSAPGSPEAPPSEDSPEARAGSSPAGGTPPTSPNAAPRETASDPSPTSYAGSPSRPGGHASGHGAGAQNTASSSPRAPANDTDVKDAKQAKAARRASAMQAFFVANAARNLLPSDSVGSTTPDLKRED